MVLISRYTPYRHHPFLVLLASVLPEAFESLRGDLRVDHRAGNARVTHERLNRSRVDALIGQLEPAAMAEHMGMD